MLHFLRAAARRPDILVVEIEPGQQRRITAGQRRAIAERWIAGESAPRGLINGEGVEGFLIDLLLYLVGLNHSHVAGIVTYFSL